MAYLLDTNVAIDLRDSKALVKARVGALSAVPQITAMTKVELEGGIYAILELSKKRRAAVDAMLAHIEVIDFTSEMATVYGSIIASVGFSRRKIIDRMIASTALSLNLILITANGQDFADIDGLQLEVWQS